MFNMFISSTTEHKSLHDCKSNRSTGTAFHNRNNTIATASKTAADTYTVAPDMSKTFDTVNIHTFICNHYVPTISNDAKLT